MPASPSAPATALPAFAKPFTLRDQFYVSCLWLAYNVQWGALLAVVLPSQIEAIVGPERKEFFNGIVGPLGALVALLVTPIAGALSDRSRHPMGRRRPYLIVGTLVNVLFLAWMAMFGKGDNIWLFAVAYMGIQFGCNWLGGPYAGLIPDVVPPAQVGRASGWQGLMTALGTIVGAVAAGQLLLGGSYAPVYGLAIVVFLVMLVLTVRGVKERALEGQAPPFELGAFIRSFWIDPKEHRDFYWVLITRAFVTMGVYSVFTFFQYFLADVIKVPDPTTQTSYLIAIIISMGIPTSIIAGSLSDKHGRKPLVYLSGGIMALASAIFIGVAFNPSLGFCFAVAALFGIGNGAYTAVDWALAVDVLPSGEDAAKDMGIWHIAMVLPQILAPFVTGTVLTLFKEQGMLLTGYTAVFIMTAIWFVLGTVFVKQIRGVR